MAFIVNGVCRYTIHGKFQNRAVANVLDMEIDTTGSATLRGDAIQNQAGILINQWKTDILPKLSLLYTFEMVSWVDLDEDDGSTGFRTVSGATTLPLPGGDSLSPMPAQVSVLIKKNTDGGRGRRKGRLYLAGVTEPETQSTTPNILDPTVVTALNTSFTAFLGNINQDAGTFDFGSRLVVVHILTRAPVELGKKPPGAPLTGDFKRVNSMGADSLLATQRRRLRG